MSYERNQCNSRIVRNPDVPNEHSATRVLPAEFGGRGVGAGPPWLSHQPLAFALYVSRTHKTGKSPRKIAGMHTKATGVTGVACGARAGGGTGGAARGPGARRMARR